MVPLLLSLLSFHISSKTKLNDNCKASGALVWNIYHQIHQNISCILNLSYRWFLGLLEVKTGTHDQHFVPSACHIQSILLLSWTLVKARKDLVRNIQIKVRENGVLRYGMKPLIFSCLCGTRTTARNTNITSLRLP